MSPPDAPGDVSTVRCVRLDVADSDAFAAAVAAAEASFGPVGCLVNSAGMADGRPFDQVAAADYQREITSGLIGVLNGSRR
jgi:NADP-dependent 3-hydroxy acid dehydrogenase YdfG